MVTAAKGAQNFYNYTTEEKERENSSENSSENDGLKVRKESPELVKMN